MLKDLQEQARRYPQALDWIDDHADLLDTNLVDYLTEVYHSLDTGANQFVLEFLIDPDGAGFTKEEVLGIVINDYKIGKWDGLDDWNKDCARASITVKEKLNYIKFVYNSNQYTYPPISHDDLIKAGLEYTSYLNNCSIPHIGFSCNSYYSISDYKNYCREQDLYVAVERGIEMPAIWRDKCAQLSEEFYVFDCDDIRTVTSKNTFYFKPKLNYQYSIRRPFIMVSVNHMAKAGLDKAYPNVIIPKHIVDKYELPVVEY